MTDASAEAAVRTAQGPVVGRIKRRGSGLPAAKLRSNAPDRAQEAAPTSTCDLWERHSCREIPQRKRETLRLCGEQRASMPTRSRARFQRLDAAQLARERNEAANQADRQAPPQQTRFFPATFRAAAAKHHTARRPRDRYRHRPRQHSRCSAGINIRVVPTLAAPAPSPRLPCAHRQPRG
jgi:hypothetical protein